MGWFEKTTGSHDWGLRVLALLVFLGGVVVIRIKIKADDPVKGNAQGVAAET
jgi:hypothetical protein